jgi:hypothetical protein
VDLEWCTSHGLEIGPRGRHESARAIREDQDESERAVASHPSQDRQGLTFERMPAPNDGDGWRKVIEVGSVAWVRWNPHTNPT